LAQRGRNLNDSIFKNSNAWEGPGNIITSDDTPRHFTSLKNSFTYWADKKENTENFSPQARQIS